MTTHVKLGVTFDLNGKPISLQPKEAIDEIAVNGINLSLPEPMELGEAGTGIDSILRKLGSDMKVSMPAADNNKDKKYIYNNLPEFKLLQDAYAKVVGAELNVEKFDAKIPGSSTRKADGKTTETEIKYTIGLSATWHLTGDETGLTLTGIYFEVSNEEIPAAPEKTVVPAT